ncbi:hypothetical protein RND81_03G214000 [Saponaria officinalis]|uniref:Water stress and hypersensitive response domain-containing protein n=1 Tax=Saponaria officinalis TaxID=3572 RepID=A0AAW1M6A2_SAPOF
MAGLMEKAKNFVAEKMGDVPKPEANIDDVDLKNLDKTGVTYLAKVGITNPYSHSIPICEITFSLSSATRVIASGTVPDPGSIKASETTVVDVPMLVPHNILMSLAKDIWKDGDIDYELVIGLIVDLPVIGNFTIPLTTKGDIKLPTLGSIFGGGGGDDDEKKDEKKDDE